MRYPFLALISLVIPTTLAQRATPAEPERSEVVAILPAAAGPELLRQCSRHTIVGADSFWAPSRDQVAFVEATLPYFLSRPGIRAPGAPLADYYRQYLGVVARGKRLIYASFFHKSKLRDFETSWRNAAVVRCDGGDRFWGIVFDVDTSTFEPPEFNGER